VAAPGGVFKVTTELYERFGREPVFDTPISELAPHRRRLWSRLTGLAL